MWLLCLLLAPCNNDQFTCFNRHCVPYAVVCDGRDDCGDASDEGYWHARCPGFTSFNFTLIM